MLTCLKIIILLTVSPEEIFIKTSTAGSAATGANGPPLCRSLPSRQSTSAAGLLQFCNFHFFLTVYSSVFHLLLQKQSHLKPIPSLKLLIRTAEHVVPHYYAPFITISISDDSGAPNSRSFHKYPTNISLSVAHRKRQDSKVKPVFGKEV